MKTLDDIRNELAKKDYGFDSWESFTDSVFEDTESGSFIDIESAFDEVAKTYAEQIATEALRIAAEQARTTGSCQIWNCEGERVDKPSITSVDIKALLK